MLLKPERKEKKKPIFAAKKNDNLSLKNVIMVTINLKLGKKRQQIIHGGKRCEKKKKLKKYICVVCSFYACCIFRSHLCIQNWCRRITIPSPFTPFVSYKKRKWMRLDKDDLNFDEAHFQKINSSFSMYHSFPHYVLTIKRCSTTIFHCFTSLWWKYKLLSYPKNKILWILKVVKKHQWSFCHSGRINSTVATSRHF